MKIISTNTVCVGYKFVIVLPSNAGYIIGREVAPLEYTSEGMQSTMERPHSQGETADHFISEELPEIATKNKTKQQ